MSGGRGDGLPQVFPIRFQAGDRGSQIVVVDSDFRKLATGVGSLNMNLEPGLYKARFKSGDRIHDELFEVPGDRKEIRAPRLEFSSPIPLSGFAGHHEYQEGPARAVVSGPADAQLGAGAEILVFVRDSQHPRGEIVADAPCWDGLCLRSITGEVLLEVAGTGRANPADGWAAVKVVVDPGVYLLARPERSNSNTVWEIPVVACQDWCTGVFLDAVDPLEPDADRGKARYADLDGAAVTMSHMGGGAALNEQMARLTELARQGLASGQPAISESDLREMLDGKAEFPMLGLYAAHLLLARPEKDWRLIAIIAGNLDRWLSSGHPDVDVLCRACAPHFPVERSSVVANRWPPMLAASWDLDATLQADGLARDEETVAYIDQYRSSGGIWTSLRRPRAIPSLPAVDPFDAATPSSPVRRLATKSLLKVVRHIAGPDRATLGDSVWTSIDGFGEFLEEAIRGPELDVPDLWRKIRDGLRQPHPDHTPFQQALRRRVLDLLDAAEDDDLDIPELAQQFGLSAAAAWRACRQVYTMARRAHEEAVRADEPELMG